MKENRDILENGALRGRSGSVPSDYFDSLQRRLMAIPQDYPLIHEETVRKPGLWMRVRPYAALAASFALILAVGTVAMRRPLENVDDSTYEQLLFADMIPHMDPYSGDYQDETELSSDELLEYLICNNVQPYPQDLTAD